MGYTDTFMPADTACVNETKGNCNSCSNGFCYHGHCSYGYITKPGYNGEVASQEWCYCICDEGWTGKFCDKCCMLPCVHGFCDFHPDSDNDDNYKIFCSCSSGYTGQYCEKLAPTTTPITILTARDFWNGYTITSVTIPLFITVILFILVAVIPYIMYKKRNILILKILYRFKKFEDDDSRMYDVFLSYRTSDKINRDFAIYKLLKTLESWDLKVCIDERDFIPGGAISETIKVAIKESRRTILVLSPAYIEGEWPEFEVQCAIIETLSKAHRIIPIIFEPIKDCKNISPSLKHILESITYIEWPTDGNDVKAEDEFWRRLKLSMPKKKSVILHKKETIKKDNKLLNDKERRASVENRINDKTECAFIMDAKPGEYTNKLLFPPGSFPMPTGC